MPLNEGFALVACGCEHSSFPVQRHGDNIITMSKTYNSRQLAFFKRIERAIKSLLDQDTYGGSIKGPVCIGTRKRADGRIIEFSIHAEYRDPRSDKESSRPR